MHGVPATRALPELSACPKRRSRSTSVTYSRNYRLITGFRRHCLREIPWPNESCSDKTARSYNSTVLISDQFLTNCGSVNAMRCRRGATSIRNNVSRHVRPIRKPAAPTLARAQPLPERVTPQQITPCIRGIGGPLRVLRVSSGVPRPEQEVPPSEIQRSRR